MRHVLVLWTALACVAPAWVQAQGPDTIGLWFDTAYTVNIMDAPVGEPFPAYLVLHEPSVEPIAGLEFAFDISEPSVVVLDVVWSGNPEVIEGASCNLAWHETPLPAEAAVLLVTYTLLVTTADEVIFRVRECVDGPCAFYVPPAQQPITCLTTVFADDVVACLGCTVGTEAVGWTAVKSLYR